MCACACDVLRRWRVHEENAQMGRGAGAGMEGAHVERAGSGMCARCARDKGAASSPYEHRFRVVAVLQPQGFTRRPSQKC